MKQKAIITLVVMLAIAGAISYGIIWYRKKASSSTGSGTDSSSGTNTGTGSSTSTGSGTGYQLPTINSYAWWINKLGHAKFPIGYGSVGVEVVKIQEVLNAMAAKKKLNVAALTIDGKWGTKTESLFVSLFPGFSAVPTSLFLTDFDPEGEIL